MDTEEKIIEAAEAVFIKKGLDGARMQEIADEAKINKALLHYYFRTKEKLFNAIITRIITLAFPKIANALFSNIPMKEKVELIIDVYLNLMKKHPYLPFFILREINRDGSFIFKLIDTLSVDVQPVMNYIEGAMIRGEIARMDPPQVVLNIVALCVFPYAAKPVVHHVLLKGDKAETEVFFDERKDMLKKFIWNAIKPEEIN